MIQLSDLLYPGEYTSPMDAAALSVCGICYDTAKLTPGCVFVCLRGTRCDTHSLLPAVAAAGAAAAVVEDGAAYSAPDGFPVFSVASTRRMLAFMYDRFCGCPAAEMHLVAVTGTNGKTSTAAMLWAILRQAGYRAALIGTVACRAEENDYAPSAENEPRRTMTTPDPDILYPMLADMRRDGTDYVVMEASSHALALDKLAPLHFDIGIFTNLSPEHLDFHGTMENYLAAKARLFSLCDCGIVNADSEYAEPLLRNARCEVLRCGVVREEDYRAEEIVSRGARGIGYIYKTPLLRMAVSLPIPGSFTVCNSLLALTAALKLGVSPMEAKEALSEIGGVPGRLEALPLDPTQAHFSVFIDYAHTEAALRNLLVTVCNFRRSGERIVLLFGCGGDRDRGKRAPMGRVAEEYADFIIVTSDNSRTEEPTKIIHDILTGMQDRKKRRVIVNRRKAIEYAIRTAQDGDIILLVGKGHERYELVNGERRPFDEKEIVRQALLRRREDGEKVNHENHT